MAYSFTPQQQQPQQSLFQSPFQQQQQQQSNPFQNQQSSLFQIQQPQQQQSNQFQFQFQPQMQQQQHQAQQSQPQLYLLTNDKAPATYSTKWTDLHPDSQKVLLQIEEKILENRDESQRLDQCSRLYDSSVSRNGFEVDASYVIQELGGVGAASERQKATLQELMTVVKDLLRNTEVAVRSFMILRPRFLHQNRTTSSSGTLNSQPSTALAQPSSNQPASSPPVPVVDFYSGLPKKPSPFLQQTVARFEKYLAECRQWVEELEQLLLEAQKNSLNSNTSLLQALPKVMSNVHDFFVHVAAKVESIHQYIESMKTAYLADQRRHGEGDDPFLEADRRETARQEAAARRTHPTLHLPAVPQPTTQVNGFLPAAPSSSSSPPLSSSTAPAMLLSSTPAASSGSGLSLFSTPLAQTSPAPSLFSTPTTTSAAFTQSSPLASFSAASSGFGVSTPILGSTPAFSTPFATGASVAGSGASFGTLAKARAKSRTSRR